MPLIIITGLPCSGKTHRAQQIASSLTDFVSSSTDPTISKRTVQVIPSYHASSDNDHNSLDSTTALRDQIYTSASLEKTARAAEFSAIKRAVSKDNVVIADGLNYIKGYRYQLWCEAKAAGTRCCVVHVAAREDECRKWNRERLRAWGRDEKGGQDEDEEGVEKKEASKQGENVLGELMPESHTAIYGDRVIENVSRSRSSSMDGIDDGDENKNGATRAKAEDTMTLKSLYISNRADTNFPSTTRPTPSNSTPQPPIPSPSILPPPATPSPPYSPSTLSSLLMRYEPPSPFSRWDTPLFTIPSTDAVPPIHEISNAIYPPPSRLTSKKALSQLSPSQRSGTASTTDATANTGAQHAAKAEIPGKPDAVRQHAATVLPQPTASDALQFLESATMDVVKYLLAQSRTPNPNIISGEGGHVALSIPLPKPASTSSNEEEVVEMTIHIPPGTTLSQPMLQRLRRKYTQIQRGGIAHGQGYVSGRRKIIEGFVQFLEDEWDEE